MKKAFLDGLTKFFCRDIFSTKYQGFIVATVLCILRFLTGTEWLVALGLFIGGNLADKLIVKKNGIQEFQASN